jgi:hypothetical protein
MTPTTCEWLNDYLDRDLGVGERELFEGHLANCLDCREAVAAERRWSQAIVRAVSEREVPPLTLADRIDCGIRMKTVRRFGAGAAALAASIAILVFASKRDNSVPQPRELVENTTMPAPPATVRVSFPNRDVIAVPIETASPNVTVLMVYPSSRSEPSSESERNEP